MPYHIFHFVFRCEYGPVAYQDQEKFFMAIPGPGYNKKPRLTAGADLSMDKLLTYSLA
jgi:hypothetical protein